MHKKNILVVCSLDRSLIGFRGDFIKDLINKGYKVFTASPDLTEPIAEQLREFGATPLQYDLNRAGISPLGDIRSINQLQNIMSKHDIDLVFPYTIKPVIYASMAANRLGIPVISLITGLGFTFTGVSAKAKILQKVAEFLYKRSIKKNKMVIFQNKDDQALFRQLRLLGDNQKSTVVDGSGVNLNRYPYRVNEKKDSNIKFIFVARLIKEKGIHLFINAAKQLKKEFEQAEFHVVGAPDKSPSSIQIEDLNELNRNGTIVYHGRVNNIPDLLHNSDVFVLPTYYREGVPRSILEALSVGLPIITTDTPGCKETIVENKNGVLINPNNQEELKSAIRFFLENPSKIKEMGLESRNLAQNKFDVTIINKNLTHHINQILA